MKDGSWSCYLWLQQVISTEWGEPTQPRLPTLPRIKVYQLWSKNWGYSGPCWYLCLFTYMMNVNNASILQLFGMECFINLQFYILVRYRFPNHAYIISFSFTIDWNEAVQHPWAWMMMIWTFPLNSRGVEGYELRQGLDLDGQKNLEPMGKSEHWTSL